jgi:single-strand DNA-binding protein
VAYLNDCKFLGNLTREPEVKFLPSGMAVCEFGIACNKKLGGGKPDRVLFIDVTLFEKKAQVAGEYLHKGSQVLVSGELVLDQWEKNGEKRSKHKLTANDFQMLDKRAGGGDSSSQVRDDANDYAQAPAAKTDDDDVPF